MLGILILGIFLISVFWNKKKVAVLGFCFLFLILGVWRNQTAISSINWPEEKEVIFSGIVVGEPDIREDNTRLILSEHSGSEMSNQIFGKILVTTDKYPEYKYGDKLKVSGRLEAPVIFDDFDYRSYLAKDGIYSVMYYPDIEYLGKSEGSLASIVYGKILQIKDEIRNVIYENLSPPQGSILGAMILGDKSRMSEDLKEKLNIVGLRHITAISGMHVTIISMILMQALVGVGLWRGQAFYAALSFLILFVIMVGLPSSALRAAIMAGILLLAQKIGRGASSFRLVIFAAVTMLAINPLLLKYDIGFQLSFLAVAGIIFLSPIFKKLFRKIPDQRLVNLRSILAMTLSAQVFTFPVLVFSFGQLSLVAPLCNILVLPALPFILGLGFLFSFAGLLWQPLGWVLSWPAWALLTYIFKIAEWFSGLPGSSMVF
jgi:competence protein ComEC